jgi:PTS system glucose-specific IIA component
MVGDGVAVYPESDLVVAPVAGTLTQVFPTGHAFGVTTPEGLEVLVHIGIDTVQLKGEGFTVLAEQGQPVSVNTPIVRLDLSLLRQRAKSLVTPVIVTNMAKVASIERTTAEKVVGGQDILMNVTLRRADEV